MHDKQVPLIAVTKLLQLTVSKGLFTPHYMFGTAWIKVVPVPTQTNSQREYGLMDTCPNSFLPHQTSSIVQMGLLLATLFVLKKLATD